jgi:hypothetical protein
VATAHLHLGLLAILMLNPIRYQVNKKGISNKWEAVVI